MDLVEFHYCNVKPVENYWYDDEIKVESAPIIKLVESMIASINYPGKTSKFIT